MTPLRNLVRKNIQQFSPYVAPRDDFDAANGILLDNNENAFGSVGNQGMNRYPDRMQKALKAEIAKLKAVTPDQIFLGNGSDEGIDWLVRAFCEPHQDSILMMPPTFAMYELSAAVNAVSVIKVPLTTAFQIDLDRVLSNYDATTKLLFICTPNNPTANCMEFSAIESLVKQFPGITIVDEAYIDFAPEQSWLPKLNQYPNLVILQTFSKAWGLANIRLGMVFASPEIITMLNAIKSPYNLNGLSQHAALQALQHVAEKERMVQQILVEKSTLIEQLQRLPVVKTVYPSNANFLLVKVKSGAKVYQYLRAHNILVQDRSSLLNCADCLRITVGTPEENQRLIEVLNIYEKSAVS